MFCPKCGVGNPEGAKFCAGCGAQLPQRPAGGAPLSSAAANKPARRHGSKKPLIVAAFAIVDIAVAIVVRLVAFGGKPVSSVRLYSGCPSSYSYNTMTRKGFGFSVDGDTATFSFLDVNLSEDGQSVSGPIVSVKETDTSKIYEVGPSGSSELLDEYRVFSQKRHDTDVRAQP